MLLARTAITARTFHAAAAKQSLTHFSRAMSTASEPLVLSEKSSSGKVIILRLNRPKALNALSSPLFDQLNIELEKADADESVGAIVLTGSDKAFAAGADIKEMKDKDCTFGSGLADLSRHDVQEQLPRDVDAYWSDSQAHHWRRVRLCRKSSH